MQTTDLVVWASWLLGTAAFIACLVVVWWGLFGDRARGRRRCPKCWYDLSHTAGMQCPECGHVASGERALRRTRRRLIPAVLAALAASFGASWALERAQTSGWESMLPTRLLMLGLPLVGGAHGELTVELGNRVNRGTLSDEQFRDLVDRCIAGDFRTAPVSVEWESKYGGLLRVLAMNAPDAIDVETRMLDLPARIDLATDRAWPRGVPVCLDLDVTHWWPDGTACRLIVTPRWNASARPVRILRHDFRRRYSRPFPLVVEPPPGRAARLDFTIALERFLEKRDARWEPIQEETISVDVEFDDEAQPLRPVGDAAFEQAMRKAFSDGVVKWDGGMSPVRVRFNRDQTRYLATNTGIGVHVEILCDDTLARRLDLWWPATPTPGGSVGWLVTYEDTALVKKANSQDGRWSLRVTGDPALALRAGPVESYWAGAFTIPLLVNEDRGVAPPKDWWLETKPLIDDELRVE